MSAGLPLPKQVFGHGHILLRGEKMSKSAGNVVDPMGLADAFGADALRYFLVRDVTFGQDGSYSPEAIVARVNADLANSFGNLAQRTLSFIVKQCRRRVAPWGPERPGRRRAAHPGRAGDGGGAAAGISSGSSSAKGSRPGCAPSSPATSISTRRRRGRCAGPTRSG